MNHLEALLAQMTLDEKLGMIHGAGLFRTEGVARLGIPPLRMSDGPMGVRQEFPDGSWIPRGLNNDAVTYLPCGAALSSSWDETVSEAYGDVLGDEARGRGKDVILGPSLNIKRSPLCGRNFEYMSEDPLIAARMGAAAVRGIQRHDVAACPKHFALNAQETNRLHVDMVADEETLQALYYPAFRAVVEAGAHTIMGAYNKLNGEHCCTGRHLLNEVLRKEWGFDGVVISDWGGVHDTVDAAESSLDIEMDVKYDFAAQHMADKLKAKIQSGELSETLVDQKVLRILRLMDKLHMLNGQARDPGAYNTPEHRAKALEMARKTVILLKNDGGLLPLSPKRARKVAVIGANAVTKHSLGGGSAEINALYEMTPLMGLHMLLGGNCEIRYAPGYVVPKKRTDREKSWQESSTKEQDRQCRANLNWVDVTEAEREAALQEALCIASQADQVIFVGGLNHDFDVEGKDRADMRLPYHQDEVLDALLAQRPDTVVALMAGSPVEMPWLEKCRALLWSYYNGMEGGTALAEAIYGVINPSGHLAETFIRELNQCPANALGEFGRTDTVRCREGVMVGYRQYDTEGTPVNFPFGHGLSYTTFEADGLRLNGSEVTCRVRNTGTRAGRVVVQLYLARDRARPAHELIAFASAELEAGESQTIAFRLDRPLPKDGCRLELGFSSRDIRETMDIA